MRKRTRLIVRRWERIAAWGVLLPAALVLGVRLAWGWEAAHRLQHTLAQLRARGIKTDLNDFATPEIPPERNAVIPLIDAMNTTSLSTAEENLTLAVDKVGPNYSVDYTPAELAQIDAILDRLAPLFAALDDAGKRPDARWESAMADPLNPWPAIHGRLPLSWLRTFLAALAARRNLERGDEAACIHHLQQIFTLARATDAGPTLIGHLVSSIIKAVGSQALMAFLPKLPLDAPDDPAARSLIAAMTDDADSWTAQKRAFEFEIVTERITQQQINPLYHAWWVRPLADDQLNKNMEVLGGDVEAAAFPFYDARLFPPGPIVSGSPLEELCTYADYWPSLGPAALLPARSLADTRAAAILLAARLYEHYHHAYAAHAADLLPYIKAFPRDPFAPDGSKMGYRLDPAGPTVWSVNLDGVDDGGKLTPPVAGLHRQRYSHPDLVYGAAWDAAVSAPSHTPPAR